MHRKRSVYEKRKGVSEQRASVFKDLKRTSWNRCLKVANSEESSWGDQFQSIGKIETSLENYRMLAIEKDTTLSVPILTVLYACYILSEKSPFVKLFFIVIINIHWLFCKDGYFTKPK